MRRTRVLIVDDHEDVLRGLMRLVETEDSSEIVGSATSGRMAVEVARKLKPDLVLMDFSMRDMDGIEAAARIKSDRPETEVVILSIYEGREHAERARDAGIDRWIPKSLPPNRLLDELRSISAKHVTD